MFSVTVQSSAIHRLTRSTTSQRRLHVHFMSFIFVFFACSSLLTIGCSSAKKAIKQTDEEIFNDGKSAFEDENYLEAVRQFDVIKLQFPASKYADDAQFYLAEVNFKRKEYVLAAFNYNLLRKSFPQSEFGKVALYKVAQCYDELSPKYDRDPEYTRKAIQSYSEFQAFYPKDTLSQKANDRITFLRNKLAQKDFSIAESYIKLEDYRAAVVYYDVVISDFTDTEFCPKAFVGKIKSQIEMKKWNEAKETLRLFRAQFPALIGEANSLADKLPK